MHFERVISMKPNDFCCNPTTAWLTVNRKCNFRCQWCYGEGTHYEPKETMSIKTAKELVKISAEIGVKNFIIIGGEPTLWPHLFELNRFCKKLGVTTGLITNAARFGNDEYWEKYKQYPCDSMSISVKSVDKTEFQNATKAKIFNQTMKGIERAISFGNSGVSTVYNSLVGIDGLKRIAVKCKELGAKFFTVDLCNAVLSDNGVAKGFSVEPHQLAIDIMEFQPFLNELYGGNIDIEIFIPLCLFTPQFVEKMFETNQIGTLCHVYTRRGLNFNTNGDIIPCNCMFDTIIAQKGIDFIDGQSLLAHLNNKNLRGDYKKLLRYPSSACNGCLWEKDCRGGCLVNWMAFDPSICHTITK